MAFSSRTSPQVGSLYSSGDPRRDRAFSIFYVGINLGAFLSPFVCGTLGEHYGWHYGFGAAGVGMVLSLVIYLAGQRWLPKSAIKRDLPIHEASDTSQHDTRNRILGLTAICLVSVAFWAAYEQQGNTLALWVDAETDRRVFGWEFPASWFQSLNPLLIFLLTPILRGFGHGNQRRAESLPPYQKWPQAVSSWRQASSSWFLLRSSNRSTKCL
jgi:proton-dependent oligopeptide transporter, POT family